MLSRRVRRVLITCFVLQLLTDAALAQIGSGISGAVRDSSGGVLPGVTVEAASPVLIEGSSPLAETKAIRTAAI